MPAGERSGTVHWVNLLCMARCHLHFITHWLLWPRYRGAWKIPSWLPSQSCWKSARLTSGLPAHCNTGHCCRVRPRATEPPIEYIGWSHNQKNWQSLLEQFGCADCSKFLLPWAGLCVGLVRLSWKQLQWFLTCDGIYHARSSLGI